MKKQAISSAIVASLGIAIFTYLLVQEYIGQYIYSFLIALLALVCVAFLVLSRVHTIDFKKLKLTLDKIERAKKEIYAKEEDLIKVSLLASQLIAFNSAFEGRCHGSESYRLQNEWYYQKIKELLAEVKASPETTADVLKYFHALRMRDASAGDKHKQEWHALMNLIRKDIGEPVKPEQGAEGDG